MMFWYDHDVSGWGWFAMSASMVIFWALIIGVGVLLFRALGRTGPGSGEHTHTHTPSAPSPEQLLAERFARGEIDEEEYQRRLAALHATPPHRT
jgi:putative membrane protein